MIYLVRHGRPLADAELDPSGYDAVWALRERLPTRAAWFCAPEPRVAQTAQLLTDGDVGIVAELRDRDPREAESSYDERIGAAVGPILATHAGEDVVLVGHPSAWTILAGRLGPDVVVLDPDPSS